jgi:hypothetical protein
VVTEQVDGDNLPAALDMLVRLLLPRLMLLALFSPFIPPQLAMTTSKEEERLLANRER